MRLFMIPWLAVLLVPQLVLSAEPAPIAHWKLDDKSGDSAQDSSAKSHGKIVGQTVRTMGKIGSAFAFNGKDNYVEIPNSKELDQVEQGSYSLAAWFKPEIVPPGQVDTANDADFGVVHETKPNGGAAKGRSELDTKLEAEASSNDKLVQFPRQ